MKNKELIKDENFILTEQQFQEYQAVNLTNDFMFRQCMNDAKILKGVLEEIWSKEIGELVDIQQDHHIQPTQEHRSIFCDIYARDSKGDIYILEMQQWPQKELRKRSKCYQSISIFDQCTTKRTKEEKIEYSSVSECYIAFLCCFDVSKVFQTMKFPIVEEIPKTVYRSDSMMFVDLNNYSLIENERLRELFKFILNSDTSLHAS